MITKLLRIPRSVRPKFTTDIYSPDQDNASNLLKNFTSGSTAAPGAANGGSLYIASEISKSP